MFAEAGHHMAIYDPYYAADASVLRRSYDFITASEVVEHLYAPGEVLARLFDLLRPGGWLGLMTKLVTDRAAFASWHYKLDPTHV
nr:methyltransferase domain-containing protein [Gammaproteobacteria bacterium]